MERWYMRWYIRDDGFLRNCLCSATSTIPLLNRATRNMTAYREGGDGHNTGRLRIRMGKLWLISTSLLYTVGCPLYRDVLFSFLSEVPLTNWAAQ